MGKLTRKASQRSMSDTVRRMYSRLFSMMAQAQRLKDVTTYELIRDIIMQDELHIKPEARKIIKRAYKYESRSKTDNVKGLIKHNDFGDTDGGTIILWFDGLTDEEVFDEASKLLDLEGVEITPTYYDCTGQYFAYPAEIRKIGSKTIVSQYYGYDV